MVVRKCRKHLWCTLRMTNIWNLIMACFFSNKINLSWSIILAKFNKAVVKELLLICVWVEFCVLPTVLVASVVSKPNIITLFSKNKSQWLIFMNNPHISVWKETVLQKDRLSSCSVAITFSQSKHVQHIIILSRNIIWISYTPILSCQLFKCFSSIWVYRQWVNI